MRRRARRLERGERGFTLVEVLVALVLVGLVAAALVPLLLSAAKATRLAKMSTLAKNLNNQRIDAMRNLPFHVDAQNGPYVDLLDLYFHDASGSVNNSIADVVPGQTVTGQYFSSGGPIGNGPHYRVTIQGGQLGAPYAAFSQVVQSQFLKTTNPAATPLPASSIPATYNNSTVGTDQPPSILLGVTVTTSWSANGVTKSYQTFTQMTDQGTGNSLITSQAKSSALRILTKDYLGQPIEVNLGQVIANGAVSNGSQAGISATGAQVAWAGSATPLLGASYGVTAPPNPAGAQGTNATAASQRFGTLGSCGWAQFGPTTVADVSATTVNGLPLAPSDANSAGAYATSASVMANQGGACSGLFFTNQVDGSPNTTPSMLLNSNYSMVRLQDQSGNGAEATGTGYVFANNQAGTVGAVASRAGAAFNTWVKIFPGLGFYTSAPNSAFGITGSPGLVNIQLTKATLSCQSQTANATLTYSGTVVWWANNQWNSISISWTGGGDPLAAIDLTQPVTTQNGVPVPLSSYITGISGATGVTSGGDGGVQNVEAAISVTTAPTISGYPNTSIGVELGHLSCTAQDNR